MKKFNILAGLLLLFYVQAGAQKKAVSPAFLFLSDVHLNTFSDTTFYGVDTGLELWKAFINKIDALLAGSNAPKFIVYTGDLPAHYQCGETCVLPPDQRQDHNQNLAAILKGLRDVATKHKKPLFYLPGNNDGIAGDYTSFADEQQKTPFSLIPETKNPYPAPNSKPGGMVPPCIVSNPHPTMGYYSAKPVAGLRLIALNTVIYSKSFIPVDGSQQISDGNTQLKWLAAQLSDAARKGEKAYIAMHIPPGTDAYKYDKDPVGATMWAPLPDTVNTWLRQFLGIVAAHKKTIAGILYGHTHMDELRRLYDPSGSTITEVAISCPGVTPQHYNNPGFKIVQYDAASKELLNFNTYYTVPAAKKWGNNTYNFNTVFGFPSNKTLYSNLSSATLSSINTSLNKIFTVMNGPAGYNIQPGIEVK